MQLTCEVHHQQQPGLANQKSGSWRISSNSTPTPYRRSPRVLLDSFGGAKTVRLSKRICLTQFQHGTVQLSPRGDGSITSQRAASHHSALMGTCLLLVPDFCVHPGEHLVLTGSTSQLGNWDPARGVRLQQCCDEGQSSHAAIVDLPLQRQLEAKVMPCSHCSVGAGQDALTETDSMGQCTSPASAAM